MKHISELDEFYYDKLHPKLKSLEDERIVVASRINKIKYQLYFGTFAVFVILLQAGADGGFYVFLFFAASAIYRYFKKLYSRNYVTSFKNSVIEPLVYFINPTFTYSRHSYIKESEFVNSELFKHKINRYSGNDQVVGKIDEIGIKFSDIHAEYYTRDSKGNTYWHTLFEGIFIKADFPKRFKGKTFIFPDKAEKLFGFIGSWMQSFGSKHGELIRLDDPEFEKKFVVYGSDQIEARYILSHSLMDRIVKYKNQTKVPLYISFNKNSIYLALAFNKDMFEPVIFKTLLNYKQNSEYLKAMNLAISVVKDLNLNLNIWGKGSKK